MLERPGGDCGAPRMTSELLFSQPNRNGSAGKQSSQGMTPHKTESYPQ